MNLLLTQPPQTVEIDGAAWAIRSDFTVGIRFELLMQDCELAPEEKVARAFALYYPETPANLHAALEQLLWFYRCGKPAQAEAVAAGGRSKKRGPKAYCFEEDAELIFSAFWEHYGVDLNAVEGLHWWKFRALFSGLPSDCEFRKIMSYRTADTTGLPKKQKQHYERMRKLYALKNQMDVSAAFTLADRNQSMKDYVARRFEEAEANKH